MKTGPRQAIPESELTRMLHQCGIRPSSQRLAVLGYIASRRSHPTADEIYAAIAPDNPTLSLTTVYNSLHRFVDCGLLRELEIEAGKLHYDMTAYGPHSHFTCRRCGRIFDMELPCGCDTIPDSDFEIESVEVVYRGICPDCRQADSR